MRVALLGAGLVLLLGAVFPAGGPEAAQPAAGAVAEADEFERRRLELQQEMEQLRAQMERFESEERSLLERVEQLRLKALLRQQEAEGIELERRRLERMVDRLAFKIERLIERLEQQRAVLGQRLRALYQRGPLAPVRGFTSGASSAEWLRAVGLLEHVARQDAAAIESLRADTAELERSLEARKQALVRVELQRQRTVHARSALAQAIANHQQLLQAVRSDQRTHRVALQELSGAAKELDALIERMARGEDPGPVEPAWVSLGALRGLLLAPVVGTLRLPFGDLQHPRFKTFTPHRGLTFDAPRGAEVRAIFEGEVIFQDWLRGYGHTVILDHHHGYLSVYAHLAEPRVSAGIHVSRGGLLGTVGDSGSLEGAQLYFELRRDGLPLDPEPWLRIGRQRAAR